VLFFIWVDISAGNKRSLPLPAKIYPVRKGFPSKLSDGVNRVSTQRDVYDIYKSAGLRGARVIHLNRFFNIEDYFPKEEATSVPFPIQAYDIRPAYEKGLNSHNWLFIATRTGLVRALSTILPEPVFRERVKDFASDFAFTVSGEKIKGYDYDIPMTVETLRSLSLINQPVVIDVDAGFFVDGIDPLKAATVLREKCPDIRMIILVDSLDESDVTDEMREKLRRFGSALKLAQE